MHNLMQWKLPLVHRHLEARPLYTMAERLCFFWFLFKEVMLLDTEGLGTISSGKYP